MQNIEIAGGSAWPVDPKFNPVCGVDAGGKVVPLRLGGSGAPALSAGAATEAKQDALIERSFGLRGSKVIRDTAAHTGTWCAFSVLEDATFSALTSSDITGTLTGFAIPIGVTIYGTVTSLTLSSGKIIAYNK